MARITEAYCSKEVSELLKKKGFLKGIDLRLKSNLAYYTCTGLQYNIAKWYDSLIQDKIDFVVAPTHQMAMAWLRNKGIYIQIRRSINTYLYGAIMLKDGSDIYASIPSELETYEEAVEAALKYSLENLI